MQSLKQEYAMLKAENKKRYPEYKQAREKMVELLTNKKGISQDVLSGFAGIARTHLTMIENGDKQANFETLWKIANALDMRPSELLLTAKNNVERILGVTEKEKNRSRQQEPR